MHKHIRIVIKCSTLTVLLLLSFISCKKRLGYDFNISPDKIVESVLTINDTMIKVGEKTLKLSWHDEFDTALDTNKWAYRYGERLNSNNLSNNIKVEDGLLKIELRKEQSFIENANGLTNAASKIQFTSGGIISKFLFDTGYYECNVKFPQSNGWHTSIWTMQYYLQQYNEIDMEENTSGDHNYTYHCGAISWLPYEDPTGTNQYTEDLNGDKFQLLDESFNTYGCLLTRDSIKFYFNNIKVAGFKISETWPSMQIKPANILLTSVGMTDCSILPNLDFDEAKFDYVRYYK